MDSDRGYRVVSILGTVLLVIGSLLLATHPFVQRVFGTLPGVGRLSTSTLSGEQLWLAETTTLLVILVMLIPSFELRLRSTLDTIGVVGKRVFLSVLVLATIGYFDHPYRLPRTTLLVLSILLIVAIPAWFAVIQYHASLTSRKNIVIGDDPERIAQVIQMNDLSIIGYVSPKQYWDPAEVGQRVSAVADDRITSSAGRDDLDHLGTLSELKSVFVEHGVDTAVLAFTRSDSAEFFQILNVCQEYDANSKIHRNNADNVLTRGANNADTSGLVDIDLEPLAWYDRILKRGFDVVFSAIGLLVFAPVMVLIAVAIKLDDSGPILYRQKRTATLGETFWLYKFRTMVPNSEDAAPIEEHMSNQITQVGYFLRKRHLDEIPQLWAILIGEMSVVGPRAVWTREERYIEEDHDAWRKRWFIKPGLTGLAQINHISSMNPEKKLHYDIMYIRKQSFWFDLKIVIRQTWIVLTKG